MRATGRWGLILERGAYNRKKQETRNEKRETRNEKRETRNEKQETRNEKRETRNKKRETRNEKRETRNEKRETRNKETKNIQWTSTSVKGTSSVCGSPGKGLTWCVNMRSTPPPCRSKENTIYIYVSWKYIVYRVPANKGTFFTNNLISQFLKLTLLWTVG